VEQSPCLLANNSSASQGYLCNLWNPNILEYVDNSLPLVTVLSDTNLVHAFPYYFYKSSLNIGQPSRPRSSKWSVFFDKNCKFYISHRVVYV